MDTTRAEALPGVRAVLRYDDPELPEVADLGGHGPSAIKVLPDIAHFEGEPVGAAVAADTDEIAKAAVKLIEVDWEERPFVLDVEEALKPDAPLAWPEDYPEGNVEVEHVEGHGDVERGFREADKIIQFRVKRNPHLWAGAELPSVVVRWRGDNLEMWVHEQQPYHAKMLISEWLKVRMNRITVHSPYQGCAFGGRGNPANN